MVNPLTQSPVPLAGRGLTYKSNGLYVAGEYSKLENLDITPDGTIRSRRGMNFAVQESGVGGLHNDFRKFVGNYGSWPVFAGTDDLYVIASTPSVPTDTIVKQTSFDFDHVKNLLRPSGGGGFLLHHEFVQCEGLWYYNNAEYYLFHYYASYELGALFPHEVWKLAVFRNNNSRLVTDNDDVLNSLNPWPAGEWVIVRSLDVDYSGIAPPAGDQHQWPNFPVKNHLVFKERAWIATDDTVYFSKATDHAIWAAPDGGFFKFPDQEVKHIEALGDIVYVFCDSSIYAITYDIDPNLDSQVILISQTVGSEAACVLGDTVYSIKDDSLYAINGTSVVKALNLQLDLWSDADNSATHSYSMRLDAFDDELYLFVRIVQVPTHSSGDTQRGAKYAFDDDLGYPVSLFKLNVELGTISTISVKQALKIAYAGVDLVNPVDAIFIPREHIDNQPRLFFAFDISDPVVDIGQAFAFVDSASGGSNYVFQDNCLKSNFIALQNITPSFELEIKDFSPDNTPYFMKKFRSVLLQADVPYDKDVGGGDFPTSLQVTYDNGASVTHSLKNRSTVPLDHSGYRYLLNQRSRTLKFKFSRPAFQHQQAKDSEVSFELADIRVLWSYSGRAPVDNTGTVG